MDLQTFTSAGKASKKLTVSDDIFSVDAPASIVHAVVRWQRAKRRAGTHSTLNRAAIGGSGSKPWKQKGTGRARAGSKRSPLWVGGAVTFGPTPRSYEFKLPRKVKRKALLGVLSDRARSGSIVVVDDLAGMSGRTKDFISVLEGLNLCEAGRVKRGPDGGKVIFLYSEGEEMAYRGAKNIEGLNCLRVEGTNVYDLLKSKKILASEKTIKALESNVSGAKKDSE